MIRSLICSFGLLAVAVAHAGECTLASAQHRTAVLELYTSEGCSSCPPADRWLASLRSGGVAADQAVLLAFHVDYWNRLGWPDRFAKPGFSERQRAVAARASRGIVYTPQVLLDGVDYRRRGDPAALRELLRSVNARPPGATITGRIERVRDAVHVGGAIRASEQGPARAFVALFENGLWSQVRSGENAGRRLEHDFVVRELAGPIALDTRGVAELDLRIAVPEDADAQRLGLAVYVERTADGDVLQATSIYPLTHCGG